MGVMIWEAFFSFNDKTPFKMVISSSLKGSVPSLWNCKKVFNSALRKLPGVAGVSVCEIEAGSQG